MKTKYIIYLAVISFLIITPLFLINNNIFAQDAAGIQYPVAELGGCKDQASCRAYCDKEENISKCLDFAKANKLMSDEEINTAEKFIALGTESPGGCKGKDACESYCNDINKIDECISFAEKNNLIPPEKLEEAKKVQSAIKRGVKPPPCGNKKSCDVYCDDPDHMEECIAFGAEAGFIQGKELEDAQKMLQALKRGIKPPPCKGKDACDEYCSNLDNMEVCMNFAMEAGFMSEQEKADSQKMLQALKKGIKPPPCKGKDECDAYCQSEEHMEECINFSVAAGMMDEKDAEMAKKTKGKGPGGCKGKKECDAFCNNPDNQETCFQFGKDNGLIPEEDLKRMEEGKQQMKQSLGQAPAEVLDCLKTEIGADTVEKMKNGFMPPREMGDKMQGCFQKMGPPPGSEGQGNMPPQAGPGGCKDKEECKSYCESNPEECKNFQPGPGQVNPGGQMMPQQTGPGGCKTPEECQSFCQNNPEQCKNSSPGPDNQQPGQMPPCEGENCQYGPPQGQPGEFQPPTGQQPPPAGQQPPPPPPSGDLSPTGILNRVLYSFAAALSQFISK